MKYVKVEMYFNFNYICIEQNKVSFECDQAIFPFLCCSSFKISYQFSVLI